MGEQRGQFPAPFSQEETSGSARIEETIIQRVDALKGRNIEIHDGGAKNLGEFIEIADRRMKGDMRSLPSEVPEIVDMKTVELVQNGATGSPEPFRVKGENNFFVKRRICQGERMFSISGRMSTGQ